ncbi:T. brucei spp.-specific protein [Trypanosoma brucei gambiense DAL972]|uniref:T. brucei spp.-specific protein n=1 Tax=Trypanosoma brucei gambiense (strain MHOM/CI/86/DAL972) TaxID=679716 RepID=D0A2E2_TRYB9|nr:T. brucei spp.-specific protein [Trypanosoma brucei gambiense DAL972]CBH15436.1 T. brucei spp.-specific protein [Trypanosoma brucei gambiense DAL972]|eukprot:XP_011777700.1 T. brucei spp.-specific protein [Trypanosoma brucei gambiense DAL972]
MNKDKEMEASTIFGSGKSSWVLNQIPGRPPPAAGAKITRGNTLKKRLPERVLVNIHENLFRKIPATLRILIPSATSYQLRWCATAMREDGGVLHRCVGTKAHGACSVTEAMETTPERYGVLPRFPPLFFHIKTPVAETPAGPRPQNSLPFCWEQNTRKRLVA